MKIVTAGYKFLDIDAYAGCVAYAELLNLLGQPAKAVSTAPFNESIPKSVRAWPAPLETAYDPSADDEFVLIDISDPPYFEKFIDLDHVSEVIDHHAGFEQFWRERLGDKAQIEFIGAACTQVYEKWKAVNMQDRMSETSARLLVAGILDNTLNFGAQVTTDRDKKAYAELRDIARLPANWTAHYFTECQESILSDVRTAIQNDTKRLDFLTLPTDGRKIGVGQLVVWDARKVLDEHTAVIEAAMGAANSRWFLNLVSVGEGKSFFICPDKSLRTWLEGLLGIIFDGKVAAADRLWLRKEIIKQDIDEAA